MGIDPADVNEQEAGLEDPLSVLLSRPSGFGHVRRRQHSWRTTKLSAKVGTTAEVRMTQHLRYPEKTCMEYSRVIY